MNRKYVTKGEEKKEDIKKLIDLYNKRIFLWREADEITKKILEIESKYPIDDSDPLS